MNKLEGSDFAYFLDILSTNRTTCSVITTDKGFLVSDNKEITAFSPHGNFIETLSIQDYDIKVYLEGLDEEK